MSDEQTLQDFMRTYDFATVVSGSPEGLVASHVPVAARSRIGGFRSVDELTDVPLFAPDEADRLGHRFTWLEPSYCNSRAVVLC